MADPYADADTPWRDADTLEELFVGEGKTTYEVANELGTSDTTVSKWLDKHGIRKKKSINKDRPWKDEELVRELYEERRLMIPQVAEKLDCHYQTAYRWIQKHGIETRGAREEANRALRRKPPWHHFTIDGYEVVETSIDGATKQAWIHRLVAVSEYGFEAVSDNIIHHKNGMPADNRPENLQVVSPEKHGKIHKPVEIRWGNRKPSESHEMDSGA